MSDDQTQLQERLHDAAVISGRVAHAFDNILTGILGFAELALQQSNDPTLQEYLGEVLQAARLGTQLTQQLHLFHRCGTSGKGPTLVRTIVTDEESRWRDGFDGPIELKVEVPDDLPPVALDEESLRQVLDQLLANARESLVGCGTITLSARPAALDGPACAALYGCPRSGPCVELSVTDTGSGLSAEVRRRLFHEPFYTTKPRHRGLGLAVVYRILHAHNGGLQLEAGPAGGTRVRVYLPLASAASPPSELRLWSALSS